MYWKTESRNKPGVLFGTFMILLWSVRFVVEFIKVGQTERDTYWIINTGQLLSLPMIMVGVYFLAQGIKRNGPSRASGTVE